MRVAAAALAILLFTSTSFAGECPEPTEFITRGYSSFERHSTVYFSFDLSTTDTIRAAARRAFEVWTRALDSPLKLNLRFVEANTMHQPNLTIQVGRLPTNTYGSFQAGDFDVVAKLLVTGTITVDQTQVMLGPGDIHGGLERIVLHEIGHALGLDHPKDERPGASIMNRPAVGDPNDVLGLLARSPTDCDKKKVQEFNKVQNGGGSGGRGLPPNAPDDFCGECTYTVQTEDEDEPVEVSGICCGNIVVAFGPSFGFLATGYQCSVDGWIELRCKHDKCCSHPDDIPPGVLDVVNPGTTCAAQGWWEHDQRSQCEATIGGTPCVKKEICGSGPCMPWPHYCWKTPFVPGGGGGGGDDDDPPPPPQGVQCSAKGWWNGDDLSGCEATHGVNRCERKQVCDGQPCLPDPPGYCWQPR